MSAITGIGEKRTIRPSASASSVFGTATRTISQPAEASAAIWAVVASTSWVFVNVMDWTTTGAPPPIVTPPTLICRSEAIWRQCIGACAGDLPPGIHEANREKGHALSAGEIHATDNREAHVGACSAIEHVCALPRHR